MSELPPRLDEHAVTVAAPTDAVWQALAARFEGAFSGAVAERYARVVGCEDTAPSGPRPLAVGSVVVGFHVTAADPPHRLVLEGRHRFSIYAIVFRIDALDGGDGGGDGEEGESRLRAESRAEFPGLLGGAYRLAVVGTRAHVLVVRRLLKAIGEAAVRQARSA